MLKFPINNWLAKTKRHSIVSNAVGNICSGHKEAEGVLLITHIKAFRRGQSQDIDLLSERGKEERVKQWLTEEGGAKDGSLRWMSFWDGDRLGLLLE